MLATTNGLKSPQPICAARNVLLFQEKTPILHLYCLTSGQAPDNPHHDRPLFASGTEADPSAGPQERKMTPVYPPSSVPGESNGLPCQLLMPPALERSLSGNTHHLVNTLWHITWITFAPINKTNGSMSESCRHRDHALSTKQGEVHALRAF